MSGTVSVTFSSEEGWYGTSLKVAVLTGAIAAGGAQVAGDKSSGAPNWSFTPAYSNSRILFGIYDETGGSSGQYTASTNNTLWDDATAGDAYCDGYYSGTVTASTPVTVGSSTPSGSNVQVYASYEVRPSGGSAPALDASTPAGTNSTTDTVVSPSFTPPAGAVLVAISGANNATADGSISDTLVSGGLTWTLRSHYVSASTGAVNIWTALVPAADVMPSGKTAGAGGLRGAASASAAGLSKTARPAGQGSVAAVAALGIAGPSVAALPAGQGSARAGAKVTGPPVFPGSPPNPLGVKVELSLNGVWTDVTSYVLLRDGVRVTNMGRADEASSISAAQLTLTLKNNDARFTPGNASSPYYPYIARNCPVRVSVHPRSATGVLYSGYRFSGEVSAWPPAQNISGRDNYVQVTASGPWRRITQSSVPLGSPYTRYLQNLTGLSVPASAWAMEDGSGSTAFVTSVGSAGNAVITGTPSFAADTTSFPGSDALPQFNQARVTATVSSGAAHTSNVTRFALSVPAAGDGNAEGGNWNISETDSTGTVAKLEVYLLGSGKLEMHGVSAGQAVLFSCTTSTDVRGKPLLVSAELTPSGGNIAWALRLIKPGSGAILESRAGTYSGGSISDVTTVRLNRSGTLSDTVCGQLAVFYTVPGLPAAAAALGGYAGEYAATRFARLCAEEGITCTVTGTTSPQMGPQRDDTLAALLQGIEDTDGGLLYETRDQSGLGYRTLSSMMGQSAEVTLNYTGGQLGATLAPVYDDQLLKNQWTVTNADGYVAVATLVSGALSVQPVPNGTGLYAGTASTNATSPSQVNAIAQHRLFLGTVDDVRYPTVTVNFARPQAASLFATVPDLALGDYLQVSNVPAAIGGTPAKQLVWGYSETMSHNEWTVVFNCIPQLPFDGTWNPGTYTVVQGPAGTPSGSVSAASIGAGAVGLPNLSAAVTARRIGASTTWVSPSVPYDWTFDVSGSPADGSYFICTEPQALLISAGDTFSHEAGLGGPFTVTSLAPPDGSGYISVSFTPDASSVMSSGAVFGGKDGDLWINEGADNQLERWTGGAWVPYQFGPGALSFNAAGVQVTVGGTAPADPADGDLWFDAGSNYQMKKWTGSSWAVCQFGTGAIAAESVTADLIAANAIGAGKIAAGAINGMTIEGVYFIAGAGGGDSWQDATPDVPGFFMYWDDGTGNPQLIFAVSAAAGSDQWGNTWQGGTTFVGLQETLLNTLSVVNSDGDVLLAFDTYGNISAQTVSAADMIVGGQGLLATLGSLAGGMVNYGYIDANPWPASPLGTSATALFELDVDVKANRIYEFVLNPTGIRGNTADMTVALSLVYTTDGSTPTTSSSMATYVSKQIRVANSGEGHPGLRCPFYPDADGTYRFLVVGAASTGTWYFTQDPYIRCYVNDLGANDAGQSSNNLLEIGYGTSGGSSGRNYTKTYAPSHTYCYWGSTGHYPNQLAATDGVISQGGTYATYGGDTYSWILWPYSTIQSDVSSAIIHSVKLKLVNSMTYYSSGATVQVGWTTTTSFPGTTLQPQTIPDQVNKHFNKGQTLTFDVSLWKDHMDTMTSTLMAANTNNLSYFMKFSGMSSRLIVNYTK